MSQVITINDLQSYLGTTLDAQRASIIVDSVNDYIESETNRCWGETKTTTENYNFGKTLYLRHQDVIGIDQITVGWPGQTLSPIDPTGYYFNQFGRVTLFWATWSKVAGVQSALYNDYIHVTYQYGVAEVPADLKEAAIGVAVGLYNWAKAGGNEVATYSVGSYRVETIKAVRGTYSSNPTPYDNAAEHHFLTIQKYKTRHI